MTSRRTFDCLVSSDADSEEDNSSGGSPNTMNPTESCDDKYEAQLRQWTKQIPIGLGLCPWAGKSERQGRLKYTTCEAISPSNVAIQILKEAKELIRSDDVAPLSTTLVICPHVAAWNQNFTVFDSWVKDFGTSNKLLLLKEEQEDLLQKVTMVSFHPNFLRWRGLPKGFTIGSTVQSYKPIGGVQKSSQMFPATIVETANSAFGLRKIRVRFHDDQKERYVPTDWFTNAVAPSQSGLDNEGFNALPEGNIGPPLPDNAMHRAPYPTIHLIRNEDLGTLGLRDVSRVKRKNAQRMMKLGWDGVTVPLSEVEIDIGSSLDRM